jgi:hypothetical protein
MTYILGNLMRNQWVSRHFPVIKILICSLLLVTFFIQNTNAQSSYPNKPIKVVVPYPAGGAADISARLIAQSMSESMGQPILVDNRPGANGMIGTDVVAKSAPDGYTLLFTASGPLVVNPSLYKKVPYNPVKDFAPISMGTIYQYALVVNSASKINSVHRIRKFERFLRHEAPWSCLAMVGRPSQEQVRHNVPNVHMPIGCPWRSEVDRRHRLHGVDFLHGCFRHKPVSRKNASECN